MPAFLIAALWGGLIQVLGTLVGKVLVSLGYSAWGEGQLETEVLANSWLNAPVEQRVLFATPAAERWIAATRLIGVDISSTSIKLVELAETGKGASRRARRGWSGGRTFGAGANSGGW